MDQLEQQLKKFLYDRSYLSARLAYGLSACLGINEEIIAKLFLGVYFLLLIYSKYASYLANTLLLGYPLLISVFFENEIPTQEQMLIYWPLFTTLTIMDSFLGKFSLYFALKVVFLISIFIFPHNMVLLLQEVKVGLKQMITQLILEPNELHSLIYWSKGGSTNKTLIKDSQWRSQMSSYPFERTLGSPGVESVFIQTPPEITESSMVTSKSTKSAST